MNVSRARWAAWTQGLTHYFSGKPCKNGHLCKRLVSNTKCVECVRVWVERWRAKNRECHLEYKRKHYHRKAMTGAECRDV
jgi:hypothetical protein